VLLQLADTLNNQFKYMYQESNDAQSPSIFSLHCWNVWSVDEEVMQSL